MFNNLLNTLKNKKFFFYGVVNSVLLFAASPLWASAEVTSKDISIVEKKYNLILSMARTVSGALLLAAGAVGCAIGMSKIGLAALEGMSRQPEVQGRLFTTMLIGMALIEALCLYCLVLALMLVA